VTLLTASDLSGMRSVATEAMPGTAVIQGGTLASDGGGGGSMVWASSGTVDCRIAPVGGYGAQESDTGGRIAADAEYIITVPHNASVTTDSRLIVTDENFSGTFNIEAIRERSWNVTTRVEAKREV
jgi:head-tail adaptor